MTEEEIRKIALIFETADGRCGTCALNLAGEFNRLFPDAPMQMAYMRDGTIVRESWTNVEDILEYIMIVPNDRAEPING